MEGLQIGSYQIERKLGEGGMGVVYVGVDVRLGRRAAIKQLLPELSSQRDLVERFFNEARAAASINHLGIVEIYEVGWHTDGSAYFAMKLLEGESLAGRLRSRGPLPPQLAATIGRQVGSALAAAHAQGIVHRDLKPDNIMLVADEEAAIGERSIILDFGIAKLVGDRPLSQKTRTGSVMGTPYYMSPEQCRGAGDVDHRTDIYALGCILFEMLAGQPPFVAEGAGQLLGMHQYVEPPALRSLRPDVPPDLEAAIMRALAKPPEQRQQSMTELVASLQPFAARASASVETPAPAVPAVGEGEPAVQPLRSTLGQGRGEITAPPAVAPGKDTRGGRTGLLIAGIGAIAVAGAVVALIATSGGGGGGGSAPGVGDASTSGAGAGAGAATLAACASLRPAPSNPVLGAMPRMAAPLVGEELGSGGIPFDLESQKGKVVLISFSASWDGLTRSERPTFQALRAAMKDELAIVRVVSEESLEVAQRDRDPDEGLRTVLSNMNTCSSLGAITNAWGVKLLPETFLVDRSGNVRFYFINARDWSSSEAIACVKALAADTMPAIVVPPQGATQPEACGPLVAPSVAGGPAGGTAGELRGTIDFAPATRANAKPGVIFLIAKQADVNGNPVGLPLAVDRLEYDGRTAVAFVLDPNKAITSGAPRADDVVLTARWDQDGEAMAKQPGDVTGTIRVTVPASGVKLVLDTVLP